MNLIRDFLTAVQFLTRIPIPTWPGQEFSFRESLRRSLLFFPLVGSLVSLSTALCFFLFAQIAPPLIAAFLAIGWEAVLTGGFHEDAFADSADALGGGWTRDQVLEILKDSKHGTYGVLALVIGVGLRVSLLANLELWPCYLALPWSGCLGRWAILWMMWYMPPISDRHTSVRDVGGQPTLGLVWTSLLITIPVLTLSIFFSRQVLGEYEARHWTELGLRCSLSLVGMFVACAMFFRMVRRRVGGTTGDFLGAICYLIQLTTLLLFVIRIM